MADVSRLQAERDRIEEQVRYHARKWQLGYSVTRIESDDALEVRFGKSLPPGLEPFGDKGADSYWVAIRIDNRNASYAGVEIEGAVEQMVLGLVRLLKPHRALEQPEAGHG